MALFLTFIALLILIPTDLFLLSQEPVRKFYTMSVKNPLYWFLLFTLILPLYYLAEEFFFRGFLFLGLWKKIGWHSYWITELIFTWAHIGKPALEIAIAFPVGIVLNYLTLKTRSIYPAAFTHFCMGALMNLMVNF